MSIEGSLAIRVASIAGMVSGVEIESSRRVDAWRVLLGRSLEEALSAVPLLFGVCAEAQTRAALEACESALGVEVDAEQRRARELFVALEAVDNHARQVAFEWTTRFGSPPAVALGQALRRAGETVLAGMGAPRRHAVLGGVPLRPEPDLGARAEQFEQRLRGLAGPELPSSPEALPQWADGPAPGQRAVSALLEQGMADVGRSDVALLPSLSGAWFAAELARTPDFELRPTWAGRAAETGALAAHAADPLASALLERHGNTLLARFVARIAELHALAARTKTLAHELGPSPGGARPVRSSGQGAAVVSTARGQLAHVVGIDSGRIAGYRSVAPTEWNFHPDGPLVRGLVGSSAEDVERRAALLILGLDPCVGHTLEVVDA